MHTIISTKQAPSAIGPYSQAIVLHNVIYSSGQLPLDPQTMNFPEGGIKEQTRQSLTNLQAILENSGASFATVIKTTCFLAKMEDFAEFNEVYSEFFPAIGAPARSCVQVGKLPKDALIEIEAIAYIKE
ncbi:RidA family protein [Citrobacter telavivensis]